MIDITQAVRIDAIDHPAASFSFQRRKKTIITKEKAGIKQIRNEYFVITLVLPLHHLIIFRINSTPVAINQQNNCQTNNRFSCCYHNNKNSKHLPD